MISCHDLLSKTLQMDWDGDEILVCDDKELLKLSESLPDKCREILHRYNKAKSNEARRKKYAVQI